MQRYVGKTFEGSVILWRVMMHGEKRFESESHGPHFEAGVAYDAGIIT